MEGYNADLLLHLEVQLCYTLANNWTQSVAIQELKEGVWSLSLLNHTHFSNGHTYICIMWEGGAGVPKLKVKQFQEGRGGFS